MSVQFGRLSFGAVTPGDRSYLDRVSPLLAPWGPDGVRLHLSSRIVMLCGALHARRESRTETQPLVTPSGVALTWDGCLDNRRDLISALRTAVNQASSDVSIVASAYEAWGMQCFAKFVGDWAVAIWDQRIDTVLLARDALGKRSLYYALDDKWLTWSTVLDPLVQEGSTPFALSEEYLAGWLSFFPAPHLTPYVGIQSVPPSSAVIIEGGRQRTWKYWDFDPGRSTAFPSDEDCEERFRELFAQAVGRTLRSDRPVLAELSGGMDSSSIVCMADQLLNRGMAEAPRLDTVSCYDDTEPDWNEWPFFTRIEKMRGSEGFHIDVSSQDAFALEPDPSRLDTVPGQAIRPDRAALHYRSCIEASGARVVLSGFGGDEVLGGVPSPVPELADLLVTCRWRLLGRQVSRWCLAKRKPWFHLLAETFAAFLPLSWVGVRKTQRPVGWLDRGFVERNWTALTGYRSRIRFTGGLPSFQDNLSTIEWLRRSLGSIPPPSSPAYEKRYPYLDRDLLEFLVSLPPHQLLRPGERRSLMRRALAGVVPPEILGRKRKAFVHRTLVASLCKHLPQLTRRVDAMEGVARGIVAPEPFKEALQSASRGAGASPLSLFRTLVVESWLEHAVGQGILRCPNLSAGVRSSQAAGDLVSGSENFWFPRK